MILWCRKFCHFGMGFVIYPTMIMRKKIEYKCDTYRGCFNQICQNRRPIIKFQTRKPNAENSLHPHRRIVKSFHVQLWLTVLWEISPRIPFVCLFLLLLPLLYVFSLFLSIELYHVNYQKLNPFFPLLITSVCFSCKSTVK